MKNKNLLLSLFSVPVTALFAYSIYSFRYEFLDWSNMANVGLYAALSGLSFGWFFMLLFGTAAKKKKVLLSVTGLIAGTALFQLLFWGITSIINVDGLFNEKALTAAYTVIFAVLCISALSAFILMARKSNRTVNIILGVFLFAVIGFFNINMHEKEIMNLRYTENISFETIDASEIGVTADERQAMKNWLDKHLLTSDINSLPFTFSVDGTPIKDSISDWEISLSEESDKGEYYKNGITKLITLRNKKNKLTVTAEVTYYEEYATAEWTVFIKNTGSENSPVISDFYAIDHSLELGKASLYCTTGSDTAAEDFTVMKTSVSSFSAKFKGVQGRATGEYLPYFNLSGEEKGIIAAVGWSGQWAAEIKKASDGTHITAKQESLEAYLLPDEEIRSPLVSLTFYNNSNPLKGFNTFRSWVSGCVYPDEIKSTFTMLETAGPMSTLTADEIFAVLDTYSDEIYENVDYFWMDAGWYDYVEGWYDSVGSWVPDKDRYDNGIIEISDYAKSKDCGLVLWYEPERLMRGTVFYNKGIENEGWLVDIGGENLMFNLANEDALQYYCEYLTASLIENGVNVYRQDFNYDPLPYWEFADKEYYDGRTGICENHYITNLYRYLDYIRENVDGLIIDNCASGGKRLDLEMTRRSIPLWRSDYNCAPHGDLLEATQNHTYGLSYWLPVTGTLLYTDDEYAARSSVMPCYISTFGTVTNEYFAKYDEQREMMNEYFYPLTKGSVAFDEILAMQYSTYAADKGMALIYKREKVKETAYLMKLNGLKGDAVYEVYDIDSPESITEATGKQLMNEGISLPLPEGKKAIIIMFSEK